jgi:GT2 family glycosyltransferase/SAM-dependent methyltransferase
MSSTERYLNEAALDPAPETSWGKLVALVPRGTRVLDVGCGHGALAAALRRIRGCHVTGLEANPDYAADARARCDELLVGDVATLLRDGALAAEFDVVLASDVLEHLVDPVDTLQCLRAVLVPGGVLLASIPNVTHLSVVASIAAGRFPRSDEGLLDSTHLQFYGHREVLELFARAGYAARLADRVVMDPRLTEFHTDLGALPGAVLEYLDRNPHATTYQFIIRAVPRTWAQPADEVRDGDGDEGPRAASASVQSRLTSELKEVESKLARYHDLAMAKDAELREMHAQAAVLNERLGEYHHALVERTRDVLVLSEHRAPARARLAAAASVGATKALRVLYVADRCDAPFRYRCLHGAEQLRDAGAVANIARVDEPRLLDELPSYSLVVLFRLPWSERVAAIVRAAHEAGAAIAFEVDDLVFDPTVEPLMPFLPRLGAAAVESYRRTFSALARTLEAADFCVASTETIARHAAARGKPAVVHPNLLSRAHMELARIVAPARRALLHQPLIGYLSGSNTHDGDLASTADAVAEALRRCPGLYLLLVGHVTPPAALARLSSRIVSVPYLDHRLYPWLMGRCRAVLAPIEAINDFADAKSALKVFEAGVFGVPVVASPTAPYVAAIEQGVSGFVANTPAEWTGAIEVLASGRMSLRMGAAARELALDEHSPEAWRGVLAHTLLARNGKASGPSPALKPLELAAPASPARRALQQARLARQAIRLAIQRGRIGSTERSVEDAAALLRTAAAAPRRGRVLTHGDATVGLVLVDREHPLVALQQRERATVFETGRGAGNIVACNHGDPGFVLPCVEVSAGVDTLVLDARVRSGAPSPRLQLFWRFDEDEHFVEERSVLVRLAADDAWRVHAVTVPAGAALSGRRVVFRLDPIDAPGEVELGSVVLMDARVERVAPGELRRSMGERFWRGDAIEATQATLPERLPALAPASLDFVACDDLDPAQEPDGTIEASLALLRPGGHLLVSVQNAAILDRVRGRDEVERALRRAAGRGRASVIELQEDPSPATHGLVAVLRREPAPAVDRAVDIVVPIYNAREYTRRCVESVLRHATGDCRVVLVDDASPDPEIRRDLTGFARADRRVVVLENQRNLGFVATANRGMRHAGGRDVLLLNSDTEVFEGFLDRLRAAVEADPTTGILTPFSNNATICSIPEFARDNPIPEGYSPEGFAALVTACSRRARPELPTGVGFCMWIRAEVLSRLGYFDEETFGRGYGEENDLCQRARKAGFKVRLCDDVFVYHKGKASFGDEGAALESHGSPAPLERKHPGYHAEIARFIETNPLAPLHRTIHFHLPRLRSGAERAILYLVHASPWAQRPGGTEYHVKDLLSALRLPRAVVAWPDGASVRTAEVLAGDVDHPRLDAFAAGDDRPAPLAMEWTLRRAIELLGVRAAHVHHLLHWPSDITRAFEDADVPFVWTHHDYYAVCPNWNLFDHAAQAPCTCDRERPEGCLSTYTRVTGALAGHDLSEIRIRHREHMDRAIAAARAHLFPSAAARANFERHLGADGPPHQVIEHGYDASVSAARKPPGERVRVAFTGEVAYPIKGAQRYLDLLAAARDLPIEWHVFGDVEPFGFEGRLRALALGDRLVLHGRYPRHALPNLLTAHGIDLCVILPNWDETFSYVLSEALVAGVPALTSTRGALADRIASCGAGRAVASVEEAAAELRSLCRDRARLTEWAERARSFTHRPVAASAEDHRALYVSLGWLAEARLSPSDAPRLLALEALATPRTHDTAGTRAGGIAARLGGAMRAAVRSRPEIAGPLRVAMAAARAIPGVGGVTLESSQKAWRSIDLCSRTPWSMQLRANSADPQMLLRTPRFDPAHVGCVRFLLRHAIEGDPGYAQLFWTHAETEEFSEEKSLRVPLGPGDSVWRFYEFRFDDAAVQRRWTMGAIAKLRLDPMSTSGTFEIGRIELAWR